MQVDSVSLQKLLHIELWKSKGEKELFAFHIYYYNSLLVRLQYCQKKLLDFSYLSVRPLFCLHGTPHNSVGGFSRSVPQHKTTYTEMFGEFSNISIENSWFILYKCDLEKRTLSIVLPLWMSFQLCVRMKQFFCNWMSLHKIF